MHPVRPGWIRAIGFEVVGASRRRVSMRKRARAEGLSRALLAATLLLWNATSLAQAANPPAADAASRIERGRYLANAGNCVSCHTRPGGIAFTGGLPFETALGTIYSTNITPDVETGIGKWNAADLRRAMHEGIAQDGSHLFPAFPYTSFTKVSDADVADVYAYLRALRPVRYTPPGNGVLFSMRWPLAAWNKLFFKEGRFVANPAQTAEWNRGAYLAEGLGHCSACHTPRNSFLAETPEKAYQGAAVQADVAPGKLRRWSAVNLTAAKHGLGSWSVADLAKYFQTGASSRAGTFGPMNEVIVNSLKLLTPADSHALAVYVKSLQGPAYAAEVVSPELVAAGASIYKDRCQKCHGSSGRGGFFSGPPVAGSAVVQAEDPASLVNVIIYGPTLPKSASFGAWETMPSYGDILDDSQVAAISNFMRGSWGNRASPISVESVKSQR
jgi:alcohol dehydrogenase (quinone), cytochrome c subunit